MIDDMKLLLGITTTEKDDLLDLLIAQAKNDAKDYTNSDDVSKLSSTIIKMAIYNYNRLGTEGIDSEGYSGVSYSYSADYPEAILRSLRKNRKIKLL